jgi:hypothetical protein
VRRLIVAGPQQPSVPIAQPMLQLSTDAAWIQRSPAEAVAAQIRGFLDRV